MKKYIVIVAALSLVAISKVNAQGFFNFANGASGVNAPVTEIDHITKLDGSAYLADYFYGPANVSNPALLTDAGVAQAFSSGGNAGYFFGGQQTISASIGGVATLQIRAWRASDGASYDAASKNAAAHIGAGNLIQLTLGTGSNPTPNMVGIQSFSLATTPEPATIALGLMGAGALFIRRRKV